MPKAAELQDTTGAQVLFDDFGLVIPGQYSSVLPLAFVNTGDVPLTGLKAWIEGPVSLRITLGGITITGTNLLTATPLPDLAVGARHTGTVDALGLDGPLNVSDIVIVGD